MWRTLLAMRGAPRPSDSGVVVFTPADLAELYDVADRTRRVFATIGQVGIRSLAVFHEDTHPVCERVPASLPSTPLLHLLMLLVYKHPEIHRPLCVNGDQCYGARVRDPTGVPYGKPLMAFAAFETFFGDEDLSLCTTCVLCRLHDQAYNPHAQQTIVCHDQLSSALRWQGPSGPAPLFPLEALTVRMYPNGIHEVDVNMRCIQPLYFDGRRVMAREAIRRRAHATAAAGDRRATTFLCDVLDNTPPGITCEDAARMGITPLDIPDPYVAMAMALTTVVYGLEPTTTLAKRLIAQDTLTPFEQYARREVMAADVVLTYAPRARPAVYDVPIDSVACIQAYIASATGSWLLAANPHPARRQANARCRQWSTTRWTRTAPAPVYTICLGCLAVRSVSVNEGTPNADVEYDGIGAPMCTACEQQLLITTSAYGTATHLGPPPQTDTNCAHNPRRCLHRCPMRTRSAGLCMLGGRVHVCTTHAPDYEWLYSVVPCDYDRVARVLLNERA